MSEFDLSSIGGGDLSKGILGKTGDGLKNLGNGVKDGIANLNSNPKYQKFKEGVQKTAQEYFRMQNGGSQLNPSIEDILSKQTPRVWDEMPNQQKPGTFVFAPKGQPIVFDENPKGQPNYFRDPNKDIKEISEPKLTTLRDDPMWEELAYNLQNQPSEDEVAKQEAELQAEIDAKLDKIYGVESRVMQGAPRGSSTGAAAGVGDPKTVLPYLYNAGIIKQNEANENFISRGDGKQDINDKLDNSVFPKVGYETSAFTAKMIEYNNEKNKEYKDARDCMNIALLGPENIQNTKEYKITTNKNLLSKIAPNISNDKYTVEYSSNSSLAKSIETSKEFKNAVKNWINNSKESKKDSFQIEFKNDPNLFRSLHNATVFKPQIIDGVFHCYVYDFYDFKHQWFKDLNTYKNNTGAVLLQNTNNLKNYNIIVPIEIKL